jgi:hypothetical protein
MVVPPRFDEPVGRAKEYSSHARNPQAVATAEDLAKVQQQFGEFDVAQASSSRVV